MLINFGCTLESQEMHKILMPRSYPRQVSHSLWRSQRHDTGILVKAPQGDSTVDSDLRTVGLGDL